MNSIRQVYFIGIGGIGMAALARYFMSKGIPVAGYDRTETELTRALAAEGARITYIDDDGEIDREFRCPRTTLIVYTPAIPRDNKILNYYKEQGFELHKRAEVLGLITRGSKGLCFSGTHGKTTTSSMAAHLLQEQGVGCNAFLGGILRNYNSNLLLSETSPYSVIEADEYDRSFHHLRPYIAVVTATDPDHLDIYGTEEAYLESFAHFTELITPGGALLMHTGLKLKPRVEEDVNVFTYSRDEGDFHATNIRRGNGTIIFDFVTPEGIVADIELGVPVEINIENAIAAMGAVWIAGEFDEESARRAMKSFMGPKRRFEFRYREDGPGGRVIIDDYAHHPDELEASIKSVKALYPDRKITVVFQPHLYTRTRDFAPEFARALSHAHTVILLDIYPAREEPIEGVTSELIFKDVKSPCKMMISKEKLVETLKKLNFEVLLMAGAGDLNLLIPDIIEEIKR